MQPSSSKSFFELLPPKTAFFLGFVTAILVLGTLGFLIMGACVLGGDCSAFDKGDGTKAAAAVPAPTAPAPVPSAPAPAGNPAPVTEDDHVLGAEDAVLTLIEYSDFECPFCGRFHNTPKQLLEAYPGKIRWVYRHFPLSFHPNAQKAGEASECAADQGKFWEYADKLFENQGSLGDATFKRIATELGLNAGTFNDCLDSGKYANKVRAQATEGASAGVSGTPGSFLVEADGSAQVIKGAVPFEQVKAMVDALLVK